MIDWIVITPYVIDWIVTMPYVILFFVLMILGFRQPKKGKGWGIR